MLSKKIVVAYIKNDTKLINTQCRFTGCQSGWNTALKGSNRMLRLFRTEKEVTGKWKFQAEQIRNL